MYGRMLMYTFLPALLICISVCWRAYALEGSVLPDEMEGIQPSEMMHRYLRNLSDEAFEQRRQRYEEMDTPEEISAYQHRMKEFFIEQVGGIPEPVTNYDDLRAVTTGVLKGDGFVVEIG